MSLTSAQQKAVTARGNVLLVAGAGTGKTSTLVERCLHCLLDVNAPASIDEILMVTFTEAAAAEMRQRIRGRLEKEMAEHPEDLRWPEQLALFEDAHIGTLHSFCLKIARQHFYELELDPQITVMPEEEAMLMASEKLDDIFEAHYSGKTDDAEAVQRLIQLRAGGSDKAIRSLVLRLHRYTQTLRNPAGWFDRQAAAFDSPGAEQWESWLSPALRDWRAQSLSLLHSIPAENGKAVEIAGLLEKLPEGALRKQFAEALQTIAEAAKIWPKGKKTLWEKPLKPLFADAAFLLSICRMDGANDPLKQDWDWIRGDMAVLLKLSREFTAAFSEAKRQSGLVDFADLEQHALRLLWDFATGKPTAAALQWRRKLRHVFVDEYQDINESQDAILRALSREGGEANRFLVGDVKQSIYRFRLANPRIFQNYIAEWRGEKGAGIPLSDNFRSREGILNFVNSLFSRIMIREVGGVPYDEEARLRFGDPENRSALASVTDSQPRVELHVRLKGGGEQAADDDSSAMWQNLEESEKEARLVALRLRELKSGGHEIWDRENGTMRPVEWGDMAVLLRSRKDKMESFAREFARSGVPLTVARGGFYESLEVSDLLNLLQLLDNPLQDLPVLAVLRSPLVGMGVEDLAAIRLAFPGGQYWQALLRFHETCGQHPGWRRAERFLRNFAVWRRMSRELPLSRCLETVLEQTHYSAWLLTLPRGAQAQANVMRLLALTRQFDRFQRQGLTRFLHFIEAQRAAETEPQTAGLSGDNSVSLMTIHQSKGLEFPVVVVADLGKQFNVSDLRDDIILDEEYGLCPRIAPPDSGQRYPSLPYWLARHRQKRETLGEELRLLYVAMTRARDTLILAGTMAQTKFDAAFSGNGVITESSLLSAKNSLDWLAAWSCSRACFNPAQATGSNAFWQWKICHDSELSGLKVDNQYAPVESEPPDGAPAPAPIEDLKHRLSWQYPCQAATCLPAKSSVTALRRLSLPDEDDGAKPLFQFRMEEQTRSRINPGKLSAQEIGTAHHLFMQFVSLKFAGAPGGLEQEAQRLLDEGLLSPEERAALDLPAIRHFWQSELGAQILQNAANVRRELPFTARFTPDELPPGAQPDGPLAPGDYIVVQGAADQVVILPRELWLVDFKTDRVREVELPGRTVAYRVQLQMYALALAKTFARPVTQSHLCFLHLRRQLQLD